MYTNPDVAAFKAYFVRDFPYQPAGPVDLNKYVQNSDIQNAIDIVAIIINSSLFSTQAFYNIGFLYLAAHNLCESIKAGGQGTSGVYEFLVASKSVGNVSISSTIPPYISNSPNFSMLTKTTYGARYLELIFPYLVAPIFAIRGRTHA